ncbi:MAG: hypothetical protein WB660_02445 [Candidatus Sulfotelmatobacter sp.]
MTNETEKNPEQPKQQQGSNSLKADPSQGNQSQSNPQQDISKKNPSQDSNPQHKDQPQKQAV